MDREWSFFQEKARSGMWNTFFPRWDVAFFPLIIEGPNKNQIPRVKIHLRNIALCFVSHLQLKNLVVQIWKLMLSYNKSEQESKPVLSVILQRQMKCSSTILLEEQNKAKWIHKEMLISKMNWSCSALLFAVWNQEPQIWRSHLKKYLVLTEYNNVRVKNAPTFEISNTFSESTNEAFL